jgi:Tfp pilus assembly protein PilV
MRQRGNRGTSMLEALAATGLFAVGVLGFASQTISLTRAMKSADSTSAATALAEQELEQLRSMPLGAAQLASGSYADPANPLQANGASGGSFTRSWVVSPKDTPTYGLKTVTVTVTWTDSRTHAVTLAAYVRCSTVPCS